MKKEFDFNQASAKRHEAQERINAANDLKSPNYTKKTRVNFALYPSSKDKLQAKAREMHISASSLIEILIQENC